MSETVIFDIETRINISLLAAVNDAKVLQAHSNGEFLPLIYHEPISIAVGIVAETGALTAVQSLDAMEVPIDLLSPPVPFTGALTQAFWNLVNTGCRLVSFNGREFDLPVLELMALRYGIEAPLYWTGKNNARSRYYGEACHLDLLEVLTNFGAYRLQGGLNALVMALGYAGKEGMDGSKVQGMYDAGEYAEIDAYCRLDVIRTYAVFLQLERVRGHLSAAQYQRALDESKIFLDQIRR